MAFVEAFVEAFVGTASAAMLLLSAYNKSIATEVAPTQELSRTSVRSYSSGQVSSNRIATGNSIMLTR